MKNLQKTLNVCNKELGDALKQKGVIIPVQYVWSYDKGCIVSNNGQFFTPFEKDTPLFTEHQLDRLLPKYFKVAYINGSPCIYNEKTSKYLDYTISDTVINAKARGLLIYLNLEPHNLQKVNKNRVEVLQVWGNDDKMNIVVRGIDDWDTSEIRDIIEDAFTRSMPEIVP